MVMRHCTRQEQKREEENIYTARLHGYVTEQPSHLPGTFRKRGRLRNVPVTFRTLRGRHGGDVRVGLYGDVSGTCEFKIWRFQWLLVTVGHRLPWNGDITFLKILSNFLK